MIAILSVTIIYTQDDFKLIGLEKKQIFALGNDITLDISDSNVIEIFSGFLSGTRSEITISTVQKGYYFIKEFYGNIKDLNLLLLSDINSDNNFSIIQKSVKANVQNIMFKMNIDKFQDNINISFFEVIQNSILKTCFFYQKYENQYVDSSIYGIALNIIQSDCTNINVFQTIWNFQYVSGGFNQLENQISINISQILQNCTNIFGLTLFTNTNQQNIKISITCQNISQIYGIGQHLLGKLQQIKISITLTTQENKFIIIGISKEGIDYIKNLDISIYVVLIDVITTSISSKIQCIGNQMSLIGTIENLAIILLVTDNSIVQDISILQNQVQLSEIKNIALNIEIQSLPSIGGYLSLIPDIISTKISQLYFILDVDYQQLNGKVQITLFSDYLTNCQINNIVINIYANFQSVDSSDVIIYLCNNSKDTNISNLSLNQVTKINAMLPINIFITHFSNSSLTTQIYQSIVLINYDTDQEATGIYGLSYSLKQSKVAQVAVYGKISSGTSIISGLFYNLRQSQLINIIFNVQILSISSTDCFIIAQNLVNTEVINFIDQSVNQKCKIQIKIFNNNIDSLLKSCGFLEDKGKQDNAYSLDQDAFIEGTFVKQLVATQFWQQDYLINSALIYLSNMFTLQNINSIILSVSVTKIPPFKQMKNGTIYLENSQNLCIGNCHGIFDGSALICSKGYKLDNCTELSCSSGISSDICGLNGICHEAGCECGVGQYGIQCKQNFCIVCYGGISSCSSINNNLPACNGDQGNDCIHGNLINNFCLCDQGYESIKKPCDKFSCQNDTDCNDQQCVDKKCICNTTSGGLSCRFCIDSLNTSCKKQCDTGACMYGASCVYIDEVKNILECSICHGYRELPTCQDCQDGFIMIGDQCKQKCTQCLTGNCYFIDLCKSNSPLNCEYKCDNCKIGITGEQCQICALNQYYYDFNCNIIQDPAITKGFCFQYKGSYRCLNCSTNYTLFENKCVPTCRKENCIYGQCQVSQVCKCDKYFTGKTCDTCVKNTIFFNNFCQQKCLTCNGQCFYQNQKMITCTSCDDGYQGQNCDECQSGYINVDGSCFQSCPECQGPNCYYLNRGSKRCPNGCYNGYKGTSCETCDTGFYAVFDGCYTKCTTCKQGDCYNYKNSIQCVKCYGQLVGNQCNNCVNGFVMDAFACHKQVTEDQCYINDVNKLICVQCVEGKLLVDNQCYEVCLESECQGNCYLIDNSYKCINCFTGFILYKQQCSQSIENKHGNCFIYEGETICNCFPHYSGNLCQTCDSKVINSQCYIFTGSKTGDCYEQIENENIVCLSRYPQYVMPSCNFCSTGYKQNIDGLCNECQDNYINTSLLSPAIITLIGPNQCVSICQSCVQGICYYVGIEIICISCNQGFDLSQNCMECEENYIQFGNYCFKKTTATTGITSFGEIFNFQCDDLRQSFNCSRCSIQDEFNGDCFQHSLIHQGECYNTGGQTQCILEKCINYITETDQCTKCQPELLLQNSSCWTKMMDLSKNRGDCYKSNNRILCLSCMQGWSGTQCGSCQSGFVDCPCQTESYLQCCCKIEYKGGICYDQQFSGLICQQCSENYILQQNECVYQRQPNLNLIIILTVTFAFLILLILLLILYIRIGKQKRKTIYVKVKKIIRKVGIRVIYVVLAQILSVIIALQDQYINDFFMQITVNLFSMFPFVVYFFFFDVPNKRIFSFNSQQHFITFLVASIFELTFNITQYIGVPEILQNFGQEIYKLAVPPVTLFLCIFITNFRLKNIQKLIIYAGIALPLIIQFISTIQTSNQQGFFSQSTYSTIILGDMILGIAIILNGMYFYTLSIILGKYGELGSIGRYALSSLIINSLVMITYPQQIILSIFQTKVFSFSVVSQIFFNVINIMIMMKLTVVEFSINMITSSIWSQLIQAIGEYKSGIANYYFVSKYELTVQISSTVIVFLVIILFYIFESTWLSAQNGKEEEGPKIVTGVHGMMKFNNDQKMQIRKAEQSYKNSNMNPTEKMRALQTYQKLYRQKTIEFQVASQSSQGQLIGALPPFSPLRKNVITLDKNVLVTKELPKINQLSVLKLVLVKDEIEDQVISPLIDKDEVTKRLQQILNSDDEEEVLIE